MERMIGFNGNVVLNISVFFAKRFDSAVFNGQRCQSNYRLVISEKRSGVNFWGWVLAKGQYVIVQSNQNAACCDSR